MTQREYAIDLVNSLSDEQVKTLINFIAVFSGSATTEELSSVELAAAERKEKRRRSFERLCQMTKSVPMEDEKKVLAEYREERYGR